MARIVFKKKGTSMSVEVNGEATMQYAIKAKEYFLSVVNGECTDCTVDLKKTDGIDMSFLELLLSFRKTMIQKNKKIEFVQLPNDHIFMKYLSRTGIRTDFLFGKRG